MKMPTRKVVALVVSGAAGVFLAATVGITIADHFATRRQSAVDTERIQSLEEAVKEDPSQGSALTQAYERQTEQTLERAARRSTQTWFMIIGSVLFLVCAKWLVSLQELRPPRLITIHVHRADGSAPPRSSESDGLFAPPGDPRAEDDALDLTFVGEIVSRHGRTPEAAIPILQAVQEHYRYLPDDALKRVCELTEISPSQIAGVSSFYAQFRRSPVGRHIIKVCHGTACHVSGATQITDEIRRYLRIEPEADTDHRRLFTVDHVACLGCCSLAPVIMIDDETAGTLTPVSACEAVEVAARESIG